MNEIIQELNLTQSDAKYFAEMVQRIKEYVYVKGMKEDVFLAKFEAISSDGSFICDYPILKYKQGNEDKRKDEGGDILGLKTRQGQLAQEGISSYIDYVPRFASFYSLAKKYIEERLAERRLYCPICNGKGYIEQNDLKEHCECYRGYFSVV